MPRVAYVPSRPAIHAGTVVILSDGDEIVEAAVIAFVRDLCAHDIPPMQNYQLELAPPPPELPPPEELDDEPELEEFDSARLRSLS